MEKTLKLQYRIVGRFRKDEKHHVVDYDAKWTFADAERRLGFLQREAEHEMKNKKCKTMNVGGFGVDTEYYEEYDLLELRIQTREVTPWEDAE